MRNRMCTKQKGKKRLEDPGREGHRRRFRCEREYPLAKPTALNLKNFVQKYVKLVTEDGSKHFGTVYTIDPVSTSVILVQRDSDKMRLLLFPEHNIHSLDICTKNSPAQLQQLFAPSTTAWNEETAQIQLCKLKDWLKANRIPIEEDGNILKLQDVLEIHPPYKVENCVSSNEVVLGRIQGLITSMPEIGLLICPYRAEFLEVPGIKAGTSGSVARSYDHSEWWWVELYGVHEIVEEAKVKWYGLLMRMEKENPKENDGVWKYVGKKNSNGEKRRIKTKTASSGQESRLMLLVENNFYSSITKQQICFAQLLDKHKQRQQLIAQVGASCKLVSGLVGVLLPLSGSYDISTMRLPWRERFLNDKVELESRLRSFRCKWRSTHLSKVRTASVFGRRRSATVRTMCDAATRNVAAMPFNACKNKEICFANISSHHFLDVVNVAARYNGNVNIREVGESLKYILSLGWDDGQVWVVR
uniref:AD domain-containing protein n=1 Tax=Timema bartmani TaxID=61472 RepID=A0A7R9HVK1_9NEOP|nr:unnamed protein product [Timema bartmani]